MSAVGARRPAHPVTWAAVEPHPGEYDFDYLDSVVAAAAEHGIRCCRPSTARRRGSPARPTARRSTPGRAARMDRFLQTLVARYGPGGELWEEAPTTSRSPRGRSGTSPTSGRSGTRRPRPAATRGCCASPRGRSSESTPTPRSSSRGSRRRQPLRRREFLRDLYRVGRVKPYFDRVALHPYAGDVNGVADQIRHARRVMRRFGNGHAELDLTELGWASGATRGSPWSRTRPARRAARARVRPARAQARTLEHRPRVLVRLAGPRGEQDTCGFCRYSGLLTADGRQKPAWSAFRRGHGARRRAEPLLAGALLARVEPASIRSWGGWPVFAASTIASLSCSSETVLSSSSIAHSASDCDRSCCVVSTWRSCWLKASRSARGVERSAASPVLSADVSVVVEVVDVAAVTCCPRRPRRRRRGRGSRRSRGPARGRARGWSCGNRTSQVSPLPAGSAAGFAVETAAAA